MTYLLVANTFIEAKNRYYNMTFCPAYWQWILQQHAVQDVASISLVGDELKRGDDELADWAWDSSGLFLGVDDDVTQVCFSKVANAIVAQSMDMKPGAVEAFLAGADPWLIAKAMAIGGVVVTHEAHNPLAKKKFLIPNVCADFGVVWVNTFEMLVRFDARFVLLGK